MEDKFIDGIIKSIENVRFAANAGFTGRVMRALEKPYKPVYRLNLSYALKPAIALVILIFIFAGYSFVINRQQTASVTFVLFKPEAVRVAVAGDFNSWDSSSNIMSKKNGLWTATIKLKPGEYQYSFVIDNNEWMPDPSNGRSIESEFGGINSVIDLTKI